MSKNIIRNVTLLLALLLLLTGCTGNVTDTGADSNLNNGSLNDAEDSEAPPAANAAPWNKGQGMLQSLQTAKFENINGKTVTVDNYARKTGDIYGNPNVGQGVLLAQCIKYKQAYPDEEVYISISSFHFSVNAGVCLDRSSEEYGLMRSLHDSEYDDEGYVRISYLLVYAAKIGINVLAVGHRDAGVSVDANGNQRADLPFDKYFASYAEQDSDIEGKKIGDYLKYCRVEWTDYGDKAASDMMHVKSCTVSNYLGEDGKPRGAGVWVGSINIDAVHYSGVNSHDTLQTGAILTNHEEIRQVVYNYTELTMAYDGQEEITELRALVKQMNEEQARLIGEGRAEEIPIDERIIYLGSENDSVFEFYFTPLGGASGTWDTTHNPYSKYISKLMPAVSGGDYIEFSWINVKYLTNFEFSNILASVLYNSFASSGRTDNRLFLYLPGFNVSMMDSLKEGENIGVKRINEKLDTEVHCKDFQLSYVENGERQYVTVYNSLNFHLGAMSYQTNSFLVIKETEKTGNNVYVSHGKATTYGFITEEHRINGQ